MNADLPVRHGYTIGDLHGIARLAVHTAGAMAGDWRERYDTAFSAIAEALCAAPWWPTRPALVQAGQLAIYKAVNDMQQAHGYYRRKTDGARHGAASSPAFLTFWWDLSGARLAGSPEHAVVERLTLAAVLPRLTPGQRDALAALAVHDDYQTAADSLGMTAVGFKSQISNARRRFLALWHEGETPSTVWGCDRRAGSKAGSRRVGSTMSGTIRRRRRAA